MHKEFVWVFLRKPCASWLEVGMTATMLTFSVTVAMCMLLALVTSRTTLCQAAQ